MSAVLPPLPSGWKQSRLRFVAAISPSKTEVSHLDPDTEVSFVPMEAVGEDAALDASRTRPISEVASGYTYFRDGDILIAKITPCFENGKATLARGLVGGVGFGSTEFHVVRPSPLLDARFAFHVIGSSAFRDMGTASMYGAGGQKRVPTDFVADFPMPLPPISEQRTIADFLDRETAKIDALIQKQGAFRALLDEHRRALITAAVSESSAPLLSAPQIGTGGIRAVRLRSVLRRIEQGWSPQCENRPADPDEWGVLKVGCVNGGTFNPDENKALPPDLVALPELEIQSGDLLVSRANTLDLVGSAALVRVPKAKLLLCDKLYRLTLRQDRILPEFLAYVLRSGPARHFIEGAATGASPSMKNISQDAIKDLPVLLPKIDVQIAIVRYLDDRLADIDILDRRSVEMIERLRELRVALLTAAVTGQLDVGGVVRPSAVPANDNRRAFRAVVGAEIVSRHGSAKTFGRVKLQKLLYLAEAHAGVHELEGTYTREAAGPLARDLLSDAERGMAAAGYYNTAPPVGAGDGYTYERIGMAGAHRDRLAALLGPRAAALTKLIDVLKDYDTRQVEAITTLYAVWNDALLNGETPNDDRIIRGVLEEWHPEKPDKFRAADLKTWLAWMRRNGLAPTGSGPRTQIDRLFV